ncbi:hypothetical protein [Maricaulis sp.]|uniref:hypothetical protein n=1 Tax=Maricaulis sp. TaxID=1486257 RepID=UPI003A9045C1
MLNRPLLILIAILAFLAGTTAGGLGFYVKGRVDGWARHVAAQDRASVTALTASIEADRGQLETLIDDLPGVLAADRRARAADAETFTAAITDAADAARAARRDFDALSACPATADDARVYNRAFGLGDPVDGGGDPDG